jgi:hypothetical protein
LTSVASSKRTISLYLGKWGARTLLVRSKLVGKPCQERTHPCVGCAFVRSHRLGKTLIARISLGFDFLGYAFTAAGLEAASSAIERCVERVSRLYERGVDLVHIGAYVRRWLRWARSGLRALGAGLSERALVLVVRSLVRLGVLGGCLPLFPAVAGQTVGDEGDGTERRYEGG